MTSLSTDARRAYYREGVVGAPGKLVVLRIYWYRYDELVRVVSYSLGEGLPTRTLAIGDFGPVRLRRAVCVITIADSERHATIAHGYGQLIALRRKLAVFGHYDDLVYPDDLRAIGKDVYNISRNEHILADSRSSRQGSFLNILRLGPRRCVVTWRDAWWAACGGSRRTRGARARGGACGGSRRTRGARACRGARRTRGARACGCLRPCRQREHQEKGEGC